MEIRRNTAKWEKLPFSALRVSGDLAYRIVKNAARLESGWYKPDMVFKADQAGWPADWEGRTILALTMLAQVSGREPAYLERIMDQLEGRLNSRGYLGKELPAGVLDEQQFSGHNWLLRGLLEYAAWKQDAHAARLADRIVESLYLPAVGYYADYPTDPAVRERSGGAAGNRTGTLVGHWYTSTDIGCAFMALDALSLYYERTADRRVKRLLEEMIAAFRRIDFVGASMQTHASLSAARGILRFYESTGDESCLQTAIELFSLYCREGMTENYANDNWFGRPEWTEPCAVIDSYMLASGLFDNTGELRYLRMAHRILYNAMWFAQRSNGGFGCDSCVGAQEPLLHPKEEYFEAYWCCTMRGGEGLARAAENMVRMDADTLYILHPGDLDIALHVQHVRLRADFPRDTRIVLDMEGEGNWKSVRLYLPEGADSVRILQGEGEEAVSAGLDEGSITIPFCPGGRTEVTYSLSLRTEAPLRERAKTFGVKYQYGPLLLGTQTDAALPIVPEHFEALGQGRFQVAQTDYILEPLGGMIDRENGDDRRCCMQVLFGGNR